MAITPGQEYIACDRSGYRYRVNPAQPELNYVHVTDVADGTLRKVKPASLHADSTRRTGYLLASLVDARWTADPRTRSAIYQAQTNRSTNV
ncbi:hypothetical protein GCM10010451_38730 [Streptomyces virens]|uniref:Transposase n=1 Tax=Streptomyces virens TaxID=285572 RepID=A0ABP6PST0_9ACTN|nr:MULTISPECIES: hypothetical protein [Streptomyces]MBA8980217.1 hypothetical protein [Streptomyces calvus]MYS27592.1 hypothetical protein [Streptomyces sp. SID7804]